MLSLISDGLLKAYSGEGHITGRLPKLALLKDDTLCADDGETFWEAVRAEFPNRGLNENSYKDSPRGRLYPVTGAYWKIDDEWGPTPLGKGCFQYADAFDLESGTLSIACLFTDEVDRDAFDVEDNLFFNGLDDDDPRASWLEYEVKLSALCFERGAIDLLTDLERVPSRVSAARSGRPTKWDWQGAMTAVVLLANSPDGIGLERGEQAKVERALSEWFISNCGEEPHASQIRAVAQRVMDALVENSRT